MLSAMLTLPVSGTALNIADQHLHPRNMATALILLAVERILARRARWGFALVGLAFLVHPIMAAFGASLCVFLELSGTEIAHRFAGFSGSTGVAGLGLLPAAAPLGWIFEPPTPVWRRALGSRNYYFLYQWRWYEWLGAIGPLLLFWALWQYARKRGESPLARFAVALLAYGVFQQVVAMVMLGPTALVRLTPLQPMRYLQLLYVFLSLLGGCLAGRHLLKASVWRWAVFLLAINVGMFAAQRLMFPASQHLEFPNRESTNVWEQAFAWIRGNTPREAYFALDPYYLEAPGEDYHSFRALAERSQLVDAVKDTAVVTQVPDLGPRWARELDAQAGWRFFKLRDFQRLRAEFGVDWALVSYPAPAGLICPWHIKRLAACEIPGKASH